MLKNWHGKEYSVDVHIDTYATAFKVKKKGDYYYVWHRVNITPDCRQRCLFPNILPERYQLWWDVSGIDDKEYRTLEEFRAAQDAIRVQQFIQKACFVEGTFPPPRMGEKTHHKRKVGIELFLGGGEDPHGGIKFLWNHEQHYTEADYRVSDSGRSTALGWTVNIAKQSASKNPFGKRSKFSQDLSYLVRINPDKAGALYKGKEGEVKKYLLLQGSLLVKWSNEWKSFGEQDQEILFSPLRIQVPEVELDEQDKSFFALPSDQSEH